MPVAIIPQRESRDSQYRRGAAALEFALVIPFVFLLIFGTIEIGRGFMVMHQLNSATRDACRTGILRDKSNSDIEAVLTSKLQSQGISGYTTTVEVNNVPANASSARSNDRITVRVELPVANFTWLPGGQYLSGNLAGQTTLRRE